MDTSKDYYAVLGVLPSIESDAIRAVYLVLLKKYHPDVSNGSKDEAVRKTKEFNEAYNVLHDEKNRNKYDTLRAKSSDQSGPNEKYCSNKKAGKEYKTDAYWQSYGETRAAPRQHRAKAAEYRSPWTAKRRNSQQKADRLRAIVTGIIGIVALVFILAVFGGSD
jgi:curved DNA-binding protein CbpA